jgi:hypothetical protein
MDDGSMSDSDSIPNLAGKTRVTVQATEILNVRLGANLDPDAVTSNDGPEEHTRLSADRDLASQGCIFRNKAIVGDKLRLELGVHERSSYSPTANCSITMWMNPGKQV